MINAHIYAVRIQMDPKNFVNNCVKLMLHNLMSNIIHWISKEQTKFGMALNEEIEY